MKKMPCYWSAEQNELPAVSLQVKMQNFFGCLGSTSFRRRDYGLIKKRKFFLGNLVFVLTTCFYANAQSPDSTLRLMEKVADWQLHSWQIDGMKYGKDNWVYGAAYTGFVALNQLANDRKYLNALYKIGVELDWNTGASRMMADDYCIGQ